jgi:hypothetical protein
MESVEHKRAHLLGPLMQQPTHGMDLLSNQGNKAE